MSLVKPNEPQNLVIELHICPSKQPLQISPVKNVLFISECIDRRKKAYLLRFLKGITFLFTAGIQRDQNDTSFPFTLLT